MGGTPVLSGLCLESMCNDHRRLPFFSTQDRSVHKEHLRSALLRRDPSNVAVELTHGLSADPPSLLFPPSRRGIRSYVSSPNETPNASHSLVFPRFPNLVEKSADIRIEFPLQSRRITSNFPPEVRNSVQNLRIPPPQDFSPDRAANRAADCERRPDG